MYLARKIDSQLREWKEHSNGRSAALIEGARRVGKSCSVIEFAKNTYDSYILLDFNCESDEVRSLFHLYLTDLDTFFSYLSAYKDIPLYARRSVIIFDEVQLFPRARAAIKYLVADGRYDYIETGSLMSIRRNVKDILIPSEERRIQMYPMDFEEFMWAAERRLLLDQLHDIFLHGKGFEAALHRKAMDLFRQYMLVGGMPQAVESYLESGSFAEVETIKRDILDLY